MGHKFIELTIVIPVLNEELILENNLHALAGHLDLVVGAQNWQYLIVNNGSTDRTAKILSDLEEQDNRIQSIYVGEPNYGRAQKAGLINASTTWVLLVDIEQWDTAFLAWSWENRNKFDVFTGSKRADPTLNKQAPYRRLLSWGLNALLQLLFQYSGSDAHGPKLLNMESMMEIIRQTESGYGQFDVEFMIRAWRSGLKIVEIPTEYVEQRPNRQLMVHKIFRNLRQIVGLRKNLVKVGFTKRPSYYRISRDDAENVQAKFEERK